MIPEDEQKLMAIFAEVMIPNLTAIKNVGERGGMHWTYLAEKLIPCKKAMDNLVEAAERNGIKL